MSDILDMLKENKALKAERDALAAQVEVLLDALKDFSYATFAIQEGFGSNSEYKRAEIKVSQALNIEPAACLAQVRAEAVNEFVMFLPPYSYNINELLSVEAEKYAKRQGGTS